MQSAKATTTTTTGFRRGCSFRPNPSISSVVVGHGVRAQVRREGAQARRARVRLRLARDAMLIASHRGGAGSDSGSFIDGLVRRVQALETSLADVGFQVFTAGAVEAKIDERIVGVRAVLSGFRRFVRQTSCVFAVFHHQ